MEDSFVCVCMFSFNFLQNFAESFSTTSENHVLVSNGKLRLELCVPPWWASVEKGEQSVIPHIVQPCHNAETY